MYPVSHRFILIAVKFPFVTSVDSVETTESSLFWRSNSTIDSLLDSPGYLPSARPVIFTFSFMPRMFSIAERTFYANSFNSLTNFFLLSRSHRNRNARTMRVYRR